MRLFFDIRPFSWDLEYDISYENGQKAYHVKNEQINKKTWKITLFNRNDVEIGYIEKKKPFIGGEKFTIFFGGNEIGRIEKDYSFQRTRYMLKMVNWRVFGLIMSWEYDILDDGAIIVHAGTDGTPYQDSGKYMLDVYYENSESSVLLAALGMEAANFILAEIDRKKLEKKLKG